MKNATPTKPPWLSPQWQRRIVTDLPEIIYGSWSIAQPDDLQRAKHRISFLESSNRWELVKKMVNPYEMVYTHEDPHFHPSIAVIKPLSRSYFKLIEMLDVMKFFEGLPKQTPKIRSAHVAEGPGGFIQALTTLAERNKKILQTATAMTLKPTDQRVPGWRRASSFLHHHQEVRLHYGADGTGNLYEQANQDSFVEATSPGVHLFTADGGFDFSINYDIQEQRIYNLLVCSATVGLRCLHQDGAFILKLFDTFSDSTKILVSLMGRCFREWTLYKPALSRPCNSERYFMGRGFIGLSPVVLKTLKEIQANAQLDIYPINLVTGPEAAYMDEHVKANTSEQLKAISLAEAYASRPEAWYEGQLAHDFQTSLGWCQRFHVPFTMIRPIAVCPVLYTSALTFSPQSQSPGDDSEYPAPSVQALPTLSVEFPDRNQVLLQTQKDGDSREQTRVVSL